QRLVSLDARLAMAAAKPVIIPDTVVVDHGKVFLSEVFLRAADTESGTNRGRRATSAVDLGVGDDRPGRERRSSAGQHRRLGPRPPVLTPSSALLPTVCPALGVRRGKL
ncbi:MAG: hypothetical protein JO281_21440, partial [Pseudonocardiales bacterium]|nr:hypothetical protein [Pseudonocardiales bacterium]